MKAPISQEILLRLLKSLVGDVDNFRPTDRFYEGTGINCRRWAKLFKGELSITLDELSNVCKYFDIKFTGETINRQLKLFTER